MADPTKEQYQTFMTEIIKKQIVILGPNISVLKARNVAALKVADDGTVTEVTGEPQQVLQQLVDEYVALSGLIVKNILKSIMEKYPEIKVNVGN